MKAFDHYFGLRGLLDEVEVFIWPNLTETDNLAESLSDNDTAAWLSSSLSDEDYVSGRLSQVSGKPSDNLREMFLERGGYFLLCDSRSPHWHTAEHRRWLRETLSPYALLQHLSEAIRPFWVPGGSYCPPGFILLRRAQPVHLLSRRRPTQNCVWPITISTLNFRCSWISCKRSCASRAFYLRAWS